ncbi:arsinothricin resistance N-acetyltransferase ArsN1 family B [Shewanella amazonensis]|uniref:Phosphinothricin N-acetyltransferase, putative n=1 Tax=Shewanella amazonensis (strain ATCC BAA-1098 / SB2B) TaxID=326297 RepID=A1S593_SHEAM|nr:arsinothricin resistance N-acetyltransferase ArsN1 family B [Shewanella amazonensis]ABL99549.1 phosphinothricin N-acetyltransferase, putative [Shewanella amazonensis SB2B]
MIRHAALHDASAVADIYNHYIESTAITFEETPLQAAEIAARIQHVQAAGLPWLVALEGNALTGYAYATKWKERSAYRFTVETTVYVAPNGHGKGVGTALYQALIERLKILKVNSVIGGITLPNPASIALHEKMGMKKVAHFQNIGYKFGQWQDVGYWQLNLQTVPGLDSSP